MTSNRTYRLSGVIWLLFAISSLCVRAEGDTIKEHNQEQSELSKAEQISSFDSGRLAVSQIAGKYEGHYSFENGDVAYFLLFIDYNQLSSTELTGELIIGNATTQVQLHLQDAEKEVFIDQLGNGKITQSNQTILITETDSDNWKLIKVKENKKHYNK